MEKRSRISLLVPLILCLCVTAPFPGISPFFSGMESKFFDGFFSFTGLPVPEHPVVVVAKDQDTITHLGGDPGRAEMATVLERLASAGVKVAALDFVYDQAKNPEGDARFIETLKRFPGAVLAERYRPKSGFSTSFETISLADTQEQGSLILLPLFEAIAEAAFDSGLVNVFTDIDGVIRYMPLAFLPADKTEYHPTLAFAAFARWLLPEKLDLELPANFPEADSEQFPGAAEKWLRDCVARGPQQFTSFSEERIGTILRRREILWLAQQSIKADHHSNSHPDTRKAWLAAARALDLKTLPSPTWLALPKVSPPLMKTLLDPCLRMPFSKLPWPLKGDGIPVISMNLVLNPVTAGGNTAIDIDRPASEASIPSPKRLLFDFSEEGKASISGRCIDFHGGPLPGVQVDAFQNDGGYWATATTDIQGNYRLSSLPIGTYSIHLSRTEKDGHLRLSLETPMFCSASETALPPARFLPQNISLSGSLATASTGRLIKLEADGLWVSETGDKGELPFPSVPDGLAPALLEGDETPIWASNPAVLLASSGLPLSKTVIALLEDPSFWKTECEAQKFIPAGASTFRVEGLSPARGASLALFSATGPTTARPMEIDLFAGQSPSIGSFPPEMCRDFQTVPFAWKLEDENLRSGKVWFLTKSDIWIEGSGGPIGKMALPPGITRVFYADNKTRGTFNRLKSLVSGKAVFLGTSLQEDQDFYTTPVNFFDPDFKHVPGVNLHAALFSALLRQEYFSPLPFHPDRSPKFWGFLLLLLLLPILLFLDEIFHRGGAIKGGLLTLATMVIWFFAAKNLFVMHILLPCFLPLLNLASFGAVRGYQAYSRERAQKERTKATFGRFISAQMVHDILENPDALKLGGAKKELSVMFSDLAGFTSISEALSPEELVLLMNEYLGAMTNTLFEHGGTLDKYIGDAVMAFWNHPTSQPDHAIRACRCAIAMQARLAVLREGWAKRGLPSVNMRAGVNTAECIVGFMGSDTQMNFTCMGDGVNLASRLEGANKAYHTLMMVAESTNNYLKGTNIRTRSLDFLAVKGKAIPIKVFELIGLKGNQDETWDKVLPLYEQGIHFYLERRWDEAEKAFQAVTAILPDDGPSLTYLERCEAYRVNPPGENWDGSYSLKTK